jgi:hypothetical protein
LRSAELLVTSNSNLIDWLILFIEIQIKEIMWPRIYCLFAILNKKKNMVYFILLRNCLIYFNERKKVKVRFVLVSLGNKG